MDQGEIKSALKRAPKGLTSRQLFDECDSAADLNDVVKNVHALKSEGKIKADGMRESQTVYRLVELAESLDGVDMDAIHRKQPEKPAAAPAVVAPQTPKTKAKHTGAGLREGLFEMLEKLKAGEVDAKTAAAYAGLSMTVLKSIEVQMQFEKMRKAGELSELGEMELVPALEEKA